MARKRATIIVLDSAGIGYLPDAAEFGDVGANTLGHIWEQAHPDLPYMEKMGLGRIEGLGYPVPENPYYGLHHYKQGFGAQFHAYVGQCDRVLHPMRAKLVHTLQKIFVRE